jgi:AcrR family transcriptional regulator
VTTPRLPAADRRAQIRTAAARLFASRGFHGVTIEDIGFSCGISGPAVYRHFPSKDALLGDLLVGISQHLLSGATEAVASGGGPDDLVQFHLDFSLQNPELIRVQDRDLDNLGAAARKVRRLQRAYVNLWASCIGTTLPRLSPEEARARAHAVFGMLNSTPHSATGLDPQAIRSLLAKMAAAALAV